MFNEQEANGSEVTAHATLLSALWAGPRFPAQTTTMGPRVFCTFPAEQSGMIQVNSMSFSREGEMPDENCN